MRRDLKARPGSSFARRDRKYILVFLMPAVFALTLLRFAPILYSVGISFTEWNLYDPGSATKWAGFSNYLSFFSDKQFLGALFVTIKMAFWSIIATMSLGAGLAFLMYHELRLSQIVRGFIISAMIIAPIVVGTSWRLMYNPGNGLINVLLDLVGIGGQPFLAQQETVVGAIVMADTWQQSPYVMIIILAGLQSLPLEIFEAAHIDGASSFQTLRHVTLPLLRQSIMLALVIRVMDALRVFDIIFAMTKGGPGTASLNINILMYLTGFSYYQIGKAAAMGVFILIIVTIPSALVVRTFQRRSHNV